ncbi:hypothetical protein CYMTET_13328 [Cymbomonas tetramitiformis]|uniref:Uncharacterized protein n=1 Tax=Cymbomonas tetramitiformis TaxID=36881 RepID=A0AAE0GIK8_9CHLO|nr:hypothetical protein CYMTET_13328 [Cymbomonas tetramitiformis]
MTLPFPRSPREPAAKGGASPEPRFGYEEPEEEPEAVMLSTQESADGHSLPHYGRRSVSPLSGGHMLQEKALTKEEVQRQAELIRLESQQLMKHKEEQELQEALGLRATIESRLGMSARVVRSANTSSMLCADLTTSDELRQMARDLREEYRRENIVQATQMREETRPRSGEEVQRQKQRSSALRHREQKESLLKIEDKSIDVEQDVARQVAIRKWQRQRQREMAKDREAIKTFECQHNALSKQMVSAEVRHLQKLDWQYTCREVDARKQLSQMRKHEVALDQDEMRSMRRDAALTRLMQIDQLRARLAEEHDLQMQALGDKNKKNKTLHEMYAPAIPAGGRYPNFEVNDVGIYLGTLDFVVAPETA